MKIQVEEAVCKRITHFRLGVLQSGISNNIGDKALSEIIGDELQRIVSTCTLDSIRLIPAIASSREAYKQLGNDPNRYRPAADALLRRIVKGLGLYRINSAVDILNLISVHSGFSISGFNAEKIKGTIKVGTGQKNESYRGIGRGELNITNLLVLRDDLGAFGCPTSDSERTMITPETTRIQFVFYDFGWLGTLQESLNNCEELLIRFCQAKEIGKEILQFP